MSIIRNRLFSKTKKRTITVGVKPISGGKVSGSGKFNDGNICTITASPKPNYRFSNWTKNDSIVSNVNPYKFTVDANTEGEYIANLTYVPPVYRLRRDMDYCNNGGKIIHDDYTDLILMYDNPNKYEEGVYRLDLKEFLVDDSNFDPSSIYIEYEENGIMTSTPIVDNNGIFTFNHNTDYNSRDSSMVMIKFINDTVEEGYEYLLIIYQYAPVFTVYVMSNNTEEGTLTPLGYNYYFQDDGTSHLYYCLYTDPTSPSGEIELYGEAIKLISQPKEGYKIQYWLLDGIPQSEQELGISEVSDYYTGNKLTYVLSSNEDFEIANTFEQDN